MKLFKLIIFVFVAVVFLAGCSPSYNSYTPKAVQGSLDLTGWNPDRNKTLQLDGEWEFYWHSFLNYEDIQKARPDFHIDVPSTWNEYSINGKGLPGEGYATYRLHVDTGLLQDAMLGLRIHNFSSAYRLFINEKLVASNGITGRNEKEEEGEYRPQTVIFNAPAKGFDIIVQVSNFKYARGGFWYDMEIGSQEKILALNDRIMGKEIFLLGTLVILSLFFFAAFLMRRELKYFLNFACLCALMMVALDMVGQFILLRIFPNLDLKAVIFIWYSSTTWALFSLLLFVNELYKSSFSVIATKVYFIASALQQLLFTFTPTAFYTRFGRICDMADVLAVVCIVIIVAIGIRKGMKDGWLNIASMLIVLVTYIHDNLYWTNIINNSYGEIIYIGIFLFLFLQIIIQARRIREFYDSKTAAELSFLHAQIKPHFLYNAINTFISISRYDIEKARCLMINFSNYLRRSFDLKDISQFVPLKNEVELVKAYVEIQKARFEEELEVVFEVCDNLEVKVPILILQPIVENAIVHGILPKKEGGRVDISIYRDGKQIKFRVRDNGVGMGDASKAELNKQEFGSGVGLSNINGRLKKLYGKGLDINSTPGSGTEVAWIIPVRR